jgi:hypothetical protein
MKTFFPLVALICVALLANAQGENIEKVIRELEKAETEAVLKHDTVTLEKIWSDDFTVNTPANVIGVRKRGDRIRLYYSRLERNIEKIVVYTNSMVVTFGNEMVIPKTEMPMAGQVIKRRFTNIWMMRDGVWQLSARHANVICN